MTICIATPEYLPTRGGIATFYENLISIFVANDHLLVLLTIDELNPEEEDSISQSENVIIVTLRKSYGHHYNKLKQRSAKEFLYVSSILAGAMAMRDWLKKSHKQYHIDVIETIDANGYGCFFVDSALPPVVVCGHGSLFQSARFDFTLKDKRYRLITYLEKKALQNADVVLTHSPLNQQSLQTACKIDVQFATAPWQKRAIIPSTDHTDQNQVLAIGRLQAFKGIKTVVDTLIKNRSSQHPFKVLWLGGDTYTAPYGSLWSKHLRRKYPEIWQKDLIWNDSVPRQEINHFLSAADIVIIASVWEVFGYAAIEAASMGKCIIISDGAGSSYLFDNKKNAMIVPAGDSDALLFAIQKLLADKPLRSILAENALKLAGEKLNAEVMIKERLSAYNDAIEKRKQRTQFEPLENLLNKKMINLRLSPFYYFRKTILKIMARL